MYDTHILIINDINRLHIYSSYLFLEHACNLEWIFVTSAIVPRASQIEKRRRFLRCVPVADDGCKEIISPVIR
jgi:hypothetical protein